MPVRGSLAHVDLSISDPDRSIPFYGALLGALGYQRLRITGPEFADPNPRRAVWRIRLESGGSFEVEVRPSSGPNRHRPNDRYAPGMHHLAFHVDSAEDVDCVHRELAAAEATVLDAPADYTGRRGYSTGYYAAFFADPDGLKIEVAHIPDANPT